MESGGSLLSYCREIFSLHTFTFNISQDHRRHWLERTPALTRAGNQMWECYNISQSLLHLLKIQKTKAASSGWIFEGRLHSWKCLHGYAFIAVWNKNFPFQIWKADAKQTCCLPFNSSNYIFAHGILVSLPATTIPLIAKMTVSAIKGYSHGLPQSVQIFHQPFSKERAPFLQHINAEDHKYAEGSFGIIQWMSTLPLHSC